MPEAGSELGSSLESGGSTESEGEKARRVAKLKRQGSRSSVKAKKGKEHRRKYSEEGKVERRRFSFSTSLLFCRFDGRVTNRAKAAGDKETQVGT